MNKFQPRTRGSALGILIGLLLFAHELATAQPYRLECAGISATSGRWSSTTYTLRGFAAQPHPVRISLNANHILIPGFLACITNLARCTGEAVARVEGPAAPVQGSQIQVPLFINMSGIPAPDQRLGGFSGSLSWDPALLTYVSHTALQSGFTGVVNSDNAGAGLLEFNGANPTGAGGKSNVLTVTFTAGSPNGVAVALDLEFTAMLAAVDFSNLLPILTIKDGTITTAVRDRRENTSLPENFALGQNFPNPFLSAARSPALSGGNPETAISFELPAQSEVVLAIFNLVGQKVKTLVNGNVAAGRHTIRWNGTDESGRSLAAGVYIYRMQAARNVYERKMILLQ